MQVDLFARAGEFVTNVLVVDLQPPAEMIQWGNRTFVRQDDGTYREGLVAFAQDVTLPAQGYLGGIKHEDGF